jgi:Ferritin-like domain
VTRAASDEERRGGWTRAGLLRAAAGAGAVVAGGVAMGSRGDGGATLAADAESDAEILNFFLLLEYVQEGFYRETTEKAQIEGDLLTFVETVAGQESEHVAFLEDRLGGRAREKPTMSFGDATDSAERVRDTAIYLEEAAVAGYIGQGANLSHRSITQVGTLVSAEARQAAWVRNLAGVSPAPRAADPARKADDVVADLRQRGFIE